MASIGTAACKPQSSKLSKFKQPRKSRLTHFFWKQCKYELHLNYFRYISQLYSHPDYPEKSPGELQKELRANVTSSWVSNLFSARSMYRYVSNIIEKRRTGQPVSFTDFFGWLVGETLLPKVSEEKPCSLCIYIFNLCMVQKRLSKIS